MSATQYQSPEEKILHDLEKGEGFRDKGDSDFEPEDQLQLSHSPSPQVATDDKVQDERVAPPKQGLNATDWNDLHDPDNPHNWSTWLKVYHATVPALFGFAVTFGTSVYTPALGDLMRDFHISRTLAILGLTIYTLGIGLGPMLTAPLSERFGRKPVYLVSSPIFMLFTVGAGFSQSYASLVVCRFFAGFSGSPALAVGAGTNADLFPPKHRAVATSMFLVAPFAGPALGPVIGGFVAQYKDWRWTQWCMLFITIPIFLIAIPMKETYKPIILKRRAKKFGLTVPDVSDMAVPKPPSPLTRLVRPFHMLATEPAVFFFSMYTAFAFGVLFLFFAAFPYIFHLPPYSFSTSQSGLAFLSIGIGVLLGGATSIVVDRILYRKKHHRAMAEGKSYADPEHRLYSAMMGCWGIMIGLFWFGWCADQGVHWAPTLLGAIPFAWGNICLFTSTVLYLVDVYGPLNGASAAAANGVTRYVLGAVFPLFTVQMYEGLGIGWATSVLGFLALAMIPIPYVFFKYGPALRARSTYPVVK